MVLSIFVENTIPSRTLRLGRAVVVSAIGVLLLLVQLDLARAKDRVEAGDVLLHLADLAVAVELAGDVLEPQVEQLGLRLGEAGDELGVAEVAQIVRSGHHTASMS